ncbi:MAG TPA: hypothetical protein PK569_21195 [Thermoanaerobaculia bacterium]|nr:hypothetical protein [Thermoanaerobaculia bacterium]
MPKLNRPATKRDRSRPRPPGAPLAYRLSDLDRLTGLSISKLRNMVADGSLRAIRHGRAIVVPAAEVARLTGADR